MAASSRPIPPLEPDTVITAGCGPGPAGRYSAPTTGPVSSVQVTPWSWKTRLNSWTATTRPPSWTVSTPRASSALARAGSGSPSGSAAHNNVVGSGSANPLRTPAARSRTPDSSAFAVKVPRQAPPRQLVSWTSIVTSLPGLSPDNTTVNGSSASARVGRPLTVTVTTTSN